MPNIIFKQALANDGKYYDVSFTQVAAPVIVPPPAEPVPTAPPVETPPLDPPVSSGSIPLSWDDARFKINATASSTTIANGGTLSNKTITDTGQTASIVTRGAATITNVRVNSREGVRIGGSGTVTIENSYLESKGQGDDHADTIQAYSPGSNGTLKIRNSAIVAHTTAATAGIFIADGWSGKVDLENVAIVGGPYGVRIHADGGGTAGNIEVRFKDVFLVGPFGYDGLWVDSRTLNGSKNNITLWENVRNATIKDGKLIPGDLIPQP